MTADRLRLRPVQIEDAYALWVWANDPDTRVASHDRGSIAWQDHVAWLSTRLADQGTVMYVATLLDGQPVGCIRFDTQDSWHGARLSYVIAPEARGRGLSGDLVCLGVRALRTVYPGVTLHADVRSDNQRSLRVFRSQGWEEESREDGICRFWLR